MPPKILGVQIYMLLPNSKIDFLNESNKKEAVSKGQPFF
jgi:hypothetical protein